MDRGAWWATVPGVAKSRIRATKHSCIYAAQVSFFSEVLFCLPVGSFILFLARTSRKEVIFLSAFQMVSPELVFL